MQESSPEARNRLIAAMDRLAAGDYSGEEVRECKQPLAPKDVTVFETFRAADAPRSAA